MKRIFIFLLSFWSLSIHAMDELHLLHQLHTQSYQNLSHYYMFSALDGDHSFSEKLSEGLHAMQNNIDQLSASKDLLIIEQVDMVAQKFRTYQSLMSENQHSFIKNGYAEGQVEQEMSRSNTLLANQLELSYQRIVTASEQPSASVAKSRSDAILLSQMVASYTAQALNNPTLMLNDRHKGRPLDVLTQDFNQRLVALGKLVTRADSRRKFKSATGKWRMVSEPMEKYKQNAMPHLVHKYSNAIVEELNFIAQLESQTTSSIK